MLKTELCLGLPGGGEAAGEIVKTSGKRGFSETVELKLNLQGDDSALDLKHDKTKVSLDQKNKDQVSKPPAKYVTYTYNSIMHAISLDVSSSYAIFQCDGESKLRP